MAWRAKIGYTTALGIGCRFDDGFGNDLVKELWHGAILHHHDHFPMSGGNSDPKPSSVTRCFPQKIEKQIIIILVGLQFLTILFGVTIDI